MTTYDYTFEILRKTNVVKDAATDDWSVLSYPPTLQDVLDDNGGVQYQYMGLFGTDLADFSEFCYELYELSSTVVYDGTYYLGCPYNVLEYYDGFALGVQSYYYSGTE